MRLSAVERILILVTAFVVAYRMLREQWPVAIEVEEA